MTALLGVIRYEFFMQVKRPAVWIVNLVIFGLLFTGARNPWDYPPGVPIPELLANWAQAIAMIMPIGFGLITADRLVRDRRLRTADLLDSLPAPSVTRLVGKYLGSTLASAVPVLVTYLGGIAYMLQRGLVINDLGLAALAFAAVVLPGLFFVAAFSLGCPTIMPVPLYQVLFVGYWFWGNGLNPEMGIPTLTGTVLMPNGANASAAFLGLDPFRTGAGPERGLLSIALLFAGAALALVATHRIQRWQAKRA